MADFIKEITPEMVQTVDKLKATNFADATAEEIELYAEFNRLIALSNEDLRQRAETRERESNARMQLFQQQAESAINALDALAELAKAKLKAVENGQQEQA